MQLRISPLALVLLTATSIPAYAGSFDDRPADQQTINALEQRASQAQPREQCFLYAELVHQIVEFSAHQYAVGDVERATSLLKRAQEFTHKIHLAVSENNKRLKNAQILMRHTAYRLNEMLHSSSAEDRPIMQETLAQLNDAQNEAMLQVFRK